MSAARDARAPFERVADQLRGQIRSGRLKPGDRLPSGRDLAREHGVALATAQSALRQLRAEGAATSSPRGYFVASPDGAGPPLESVLADVQSQLAALAERVERLEQSATK